MEVDFAKLIEKILTDLFKNDKRVVNIYRKFTNIINYAIVCGIGIAINYLVQSPLQNLFEWWVANAFGIIAAFLWNWMMSVGPLGHWWGFKPKPIKLSHTSHISEPTKPKKDMPKK